MHSLTAMSVLTCLLGSWCMQTSCSLWLHRLLYQLEDSLSSQALRHCPVLCQVHMALRVRGWGMCLCKRSSLSVGSFRLQPGRAVKCIGVVCSCIDEIVRTRLLQNPPALFTYYLAVMNNSLILLLLSIASLSC